MTEPQRVLIAGGELAVTRIASDALSADGYRVELANDCDSALRILRRERVQVVIFDPELQGARGLKTIEELRTTSRMPEVVVLARSRALEDATAAMRFGASDYLIWPMQPESLLLAVARAAGQRELRKENAVLRRRVEQQTFAGPVIAESPRSQEVLRKIHAVAGSDAPVLLTGETGTGKGLMAKVLYSLSHRLKEPFLQVNCGALHEQLIESELFGHRKGAFSGAIESKMGLFEIADGGTLFLDEVGELSLTTQAKLLQVLDTQEFRPVGETQVRQVDVRIVAATNRDLEAEAKEGRFRRDLFFRLNSVHIALPPLRERPEDVPLLLDHYLGRYRSPTRGRLAFSPAARALLERYDWPGNVREIANLVESSVLLSSGEVIELDDLPVRLRSLPLVAAVQHLAFQPTALAEIERRHILLTLQHTGGQKAPAARLLGIDIKTLKRKLHEYQAEPQTGAA